MEGGPRDGPETPRAPPGPGARANERTDTMSNIHERTALVNALSACARALRAMGYVVLGVAAGHKRPVGAWRAYQDGAHADAALSEALAAIRSGQADRIGLVCGIGGLVCLDIDAAEGQASTRPALEGLRDALGLPAAYPWAGPSQSGRGSHLWITIPDLPAEVTRIVRTPQGDSVAAFAHLEVRARGHYVALPRQGDACGYGAPLSGPPASVPWAALQTALDAVCPPQAPPAPPEAPAPPAPPPAPPAPPAPRAAGNGHAGRGAAWAAAALAAEVADVRAARKGTRNDTLNRAAYNLGQLVAGGHLAEGEVADALAAAAQDAGLPAAEARATIRSGLRAGAAEPRHPPERPAPRALAAPRGSAQGEGEGEGEGEPARRTIAQTLIAYGRECRLLRTPLGELYAATPDGQALPLAARGGGLRTWLIRRYHDEHGGPPNDTALTSAVEVLRAYATYDGEVADVYARIARLDGVIYVDLADAARRVVEITAEGWRVVDAADCPALFVRPPGMLPLPTPERGGTLAALRRYLTLADDDDFVLVQGWLVGAFCRGPYAHLHLHGPGGSAKSTATRLLRSLIDPNTAPARSLPRDERDLLISARRAAMVAIENVSHLSAEMSDSLCRLSTGGGLATRQLYSDADETILSARVPALINGIGQIATRGDLLDRMLSVELGIIDDDQRRAEADVERSFAAEYPRLLGALYDAVSAALRHLPTTRPPRLGRLADMQIFVEAAAPALGWEPGTYSRVYLAARARAQAMALEASPLAGVILAHVRPGAPIQGYAAQVLARLNELATEQQREARGWPGAANRLSSALARIAPELRARGVVVRTHRDMRGAYITIQAGGADCYDDTMTIDPSYRHSDVPHQDAKYDDNDDMTIRFPKNRKAEESPPGGARREFPNRIVISSSSSYAASACDARDDDSASVSSSYRHTPPPPPAGRPPAALADAIRRGADLDAAYGRAAAEAVAILPGRLPPGWRAERCTIAGAPAPTSGLAVRLICDGPPATATPPRRSVSGHDLAAALLADVPADAPSPPARPAPPPIARHVDATARAVAARIAVDRLSTTPGALPPGWRAERGTELGAPAARSGTHARLIADAGGATPPRASDDPDALVAAMLADLEAR